MIANKEKTAADLTLSQLRAMIHEIVVETLVEDDDEVEDTRTMEEVFASLDAHMIIPNPGTPSVVEILREDRDR